MTDMRSTMHLYTIRFSHYNEKARWVMDRFGVPYVEHPYMPILHMLPILWVTHGTGRVDNVRWQCSW